MKKITAIILAITAITATAQPLVNDFTDEGEWMKCITKHELIMQENSGDCGSVGCFYDDGSEPWEHCEKELGVQLDKGNDRAMDLIAKIQAGDTSMVMMKEVNTFPEGHPIHKIFRDAWDGESEPGGPELATWRAVNKGGWVEIDGVVKNAGASDFLNASVTCNGVYAGKLTAAINGNTFSTSVFDLPNTCETVGLSNISLN